MCLFCYYGIENRLIYEDRLLRENDLIVCSANPVKTVECHRCNMQIKCYYGSPVWATMCVQPLHTCLTFSPSSKRRFRGVGEDRKGSVVVSCPYLLLPHRNKSPSSAHKTEETLLFIHRSQQQQQKHRAVIEWYWSTNYKTEGSPAMMMSEHEVEGHSLLQRSSINGPWGTEAWNTPFLLKHVCSALYCLQSSAFKHFYRWM